MVNNDEGHKNEGYKRRTGQTSKSKKKTLTGNNVECNKRRLGHNVKW